MAKQCSSQEDEAVVKQCSSEEEELEVMQICRDPDGARGDAAMR